MTMSKESEPADKPAHSPTGASSMHRWAACPGSVKMSEGMPNTAGRAARSGTRVHEIAALVLEDFFDCSPKNSQWLLPHLQGIVGSLETYMNFISSELVGDGIETHVEHSFDLSDLADGIYGTADFAVYRRMEKFLHVIDYKNGSGIPVEATGNKQLAYYAFGALRSFGYPCKRVKMSIVQPNCYHPEGPIRSWEVPAVYFVDFEAELLEAIEKTRKEDAEIKAGPHCVFCPAKSKCDAHKEHGLDRSGQRFYDDPKKDFKPVNSKPVSDFEPKPINDFEPFADDGPEWHF